MKYHVLKNHVLFSIIICMHALSLIRVSMKTSSQYIIIPHSKARTTFALFPFQTPSSVSQGRERGAVILHMFLVVVCQSRSFFCLVRLVFFFFFPRCIGVARGALGLGVGVHVGVWGWLLYICVKRFFFYTFLLLLEPPFGVMWGGKKKGSLGPRRKQVNGCVCLFFFFWGLFVCLLLLWI